MVNALSHAMAATAVGCSVSTVALGRPDIVLGLLAGLISAATTTVRDALDAKGGSRTTVAVAAGSAIGLAAVLLLHPSAIVALSVLAAGVTVLTIRLFRRVAARLRGEEAPPPADDPLLNAYVSVPSLAVVLSLLVLAPL